MFKNPFQVAITFAVVSLIVKVSVFSMEMQHGAMEKYIWYVYMLMLLFSVFFGIRSNKIVYEGNTTLGQDFRTGARTASIYALLMTVITYLYYSKIDPEFFAIKQQPYLDALYETAKTKMDVETRAQILERLSENIYAIRLQLSPYFHSMLTMFGLVFIGLFQSIVFALLMKKYPGFKK